MGKLLSNKIALAIGLGLTSALTLGSLGYVLKYQIDLTSPIATANEPSLAENRTNFSLAAGFIAQNQGTEALEKLSNLEQSYPILEPYIILKRGQAYQLAGDNRQAEQTWQNLVQSHPDSPAVAEALYFLGQSNPAYWQDAIAKFPQHPRTHQIIRQLLKKNPHQPRLMAILVKYDPDAPGVSEIAHDR